MSASEKTVPTTPVWDTPKINQNHPFHSDFPFKNSTKNQITTSSRFFPRLEAPWD